MTHKELICTGAVALLVAAITAIGVWRDKRYPRTEEEKQEIEDELRIW